jgi:hypothetical protein
MTRTRRRNSIVGAFVTHSKELRESPAWAALPDNARRVLDRLELEHMRHGGAENGNLKCTYSDFQQAGIRRASVALAIRQCVCLGFVEVTQRGRRSAAGFHTPSSYRLTYVYGCGNSSARTDEWRRYKAAEAAEAALQTAAQTRNWDTQPKPRKQKPGRAIEPDPDALASLRSAMPRTR